jgi:hypothetical protein
MNPDAFAGYAELHKSSNIFVLCLFAEYSEWNRAHLANTRNEPVRIHRACWMKLSRFIEYANVSINRITPRIRNQNRKYFRWVIWSSDSFFPNLLIKNAMQWTFNWTYIWLFQIWIWKLFCAFCSLLIFSHTITFYSGYFGPLTVLKYQLVVVNPYLKMKPMHLLFCAQKMCKTHYILFTL